MKFFLFALLIISQIAFGQTPIQHALYPQMTAAAKRVKDAEKIIYLRKHALDIYVSDEDPNHTGMIGIENSLITTTLGTAAAKRTATDPNFSAYIVRLLTEHGIQRGDCVLVTMTGSFPGMNLSLIIALETLGIKSYRIASLGASSFGANQEEMSWIDMESLLLDYEIISKKSDMATLGGSGDVGGGLTEAGIELLRAKCIELNYPLLESRSLKTQTKERRDLFGDPTNYKLLVNIGGNHAMLGLGPGGRELPGGWVDANAVWWQELKTKKNTGIVFDFLNAGIPVLNLLHMDEICKDAKIPYDAQPFSEIGTLPLYYDGRKGKQN